MSDQLLEIKDLHVNAGEKEILKGLNLKINKGEVHVIMGPNGAGKSTLANCIFNNPEYIKTSGEIDFEGENINSLSTDKIAKKGIFMSFQSPIEIPGISCANFLKTAKNKVQDKPVKIFEFKNILQKYVEELNMNPKLVDRNLNVGFSGGEKKKNEILQMLVLNPKLAILDETDSGLDVDAIKIVSKGIEMFKNDDNAVLINDPRYSPAGVLAPKSKADFAFIMHSLSWLATNGVASIVCFPGILYRGGAEQKIRKYLVDNNFVDCIIQLPDNLFFGTSIATCIMVLKKHRDGRDVLFIDASQMFDKGKKQNSMNDEHINSVMELYKNRETVEKQSYLASFEDIEKNDFNLNIPRYVDNFEEEEEIDLNEILSDMAKTDEELDKVQGEFVSLLKELTSTDDTIMSALNSLIGKMEV
mgnify:CR=1 FL=1